MDVTECLQTQWWGDSLTSLQESERIGEENETPYKDNIGTRKTNWPVTLLLLTNIYLLYWGSLWELTQPSQTKNVEFLWVSPILLKHIQARFKYFILLFIHCVVYFGVCHTFERWQGFKSAKTSTTLKHRSASQRGKIEYIERK